MNGVAEYRAIKVERVHMKGDSETAHYSMH